MAITSFPAHGRSLKGKYQYDRAGTQTQEKRIKTARTMAGREVRKGADMGGAAAGCNGVGNQRLMAGEADPISGGRSTQAPQGWPRLHSLQQLLRLLSS